MSPDEQSPDEQTLEVAEPANPDLPEHTWIFEAMARQQNIHPLDTIRNQGVFYRTLASASDLRPVQRLGALTLGVVLCLHAIFFIKLGLNEVLISGAPDLLLLLPYYALVMWIGVKLMRASVRRVKPAWQDEAEE